MSWFSDLLSGRTGTSARDPDYYEEGIGLLREEKFHEALTSFRLALRENPNDAEALQQLAVTYTRIGMTDEAIRTYRRALEIKPHAAGAHYGLAFLLLARGERDEAIAHLRAFLARPPREPGAERHLAHARSSLADLTGESEVLVDSASAEEEEI